MITYRKATADDVRPALDLALRSFIQFQLPDYEPQALMHFKAVHIDNENYIQDYISNKNIMFVALDGQEIVGMINEHGTNHHISEMAVDGQYHRRGIATALMDRMVCKLKLNGIDRIELTSSPHGLPFYVHYGFTPTDHEKRMNGFVFTPLEYTPNEIWDIFDESGNKNGRVIERGQPMYDGEYHLAVHVWIHNRKGEWLISKRSPEKKSSPNIWEAGGGAAVAGEDSLTAALRETQEELRLTLDPDKGHLFTTIVHKNQHPPGGSCMADVWIFSHDCPIEDVILQPGETCDARWANADKIREMIRDKEFSSDVDLHFYEMVENWRATE